MVNPTFHYGPDVVRLAAEFGGVPYRGGPIEIASRVIQCQTEQIAELQRMLLDARRQLATNDGVVLPLGDSSESHEVAFSEPSCLTVDVSSLKPGEFLTVHPKPGQSISVTGGTVVLPPGLAEF